MTDLEPETGEELDVFRRRAVISAVGILEKAQNQQRWKDAFENGQYKQLRTVDCWSWQRPMFFGPALLVTCHRRQKQNPFDHKCELRKSKNENVWYSNTISPLLAHLSAMPLLRWTKVRHIDD